MAPPTANKDAQPASSRPDGDLVDRIRAGDRLVGTVLGAPDSLLGELTAASLDFVWLDLEHGPLSIRDVHALAVAVQACGCGCLVRLASPETESLTAILDSGVDGVVVPRVEDADAVRRLVARLRYPPDGLRGFAHRRATGWGRRSRRESDLACLVQIESRAALDAAREIAAVAGVHGLIVGTADLALDLGIPLDLASPALRDALQRVEEAAASAGIAFGIAGGGDPAPIVECLGAHGTIVVYSADLRLYAAAIDDAAARVRAALDATGARRAPS